MKLTHETVAVHTKLPFVIARGGATEWRRVWVRVVGVDGLEGWGEAAPSTYYGETPESVAAALSRIAPILDHADGLALESIEADIARAVRGNASARAAVSAALHDLEAKRLGIPLYRMWGLDRATAPRSSFTISIGDESAIARQVADAAEYPILKVKLGTQRDADIIREVRAAAPHKPLRVDANAAWTPKYALRMIDLLLDYDVELVEQPVAAHDVVGLRFVRERSPLLIIADESCLVASDIPRLAGAVDGINIKLAKCGSLREALRMIAAARAHDMQVMAGCMVETSLGITAAAHLAPLLDYADLDGAALLADDPFVGATIAGGEITLPTTPGLGVQLRAAADQRE